MESFNISKQNINEKNTLLKSANKTLQYYSKLMKDGTAVTIDCWGDSTYFGHASGVDPLGTQTAMPVPLALQTVLRSYFNNSNITVNNNGQNGRKTIDIVNSWDTSMKNSTASIVFINLGINDGKDGAVTVETYRNNLKYFIITARKYGKEIILDTPNVVLGVDTAGDGMGTPSRATNLKQFAQVMREVARDYDVFLIDNYIATQRYNWNESYIPTSMPDGMHPSDSMYQFKAMQMASAFIYPNAALIKGECLISGCDPCVNAFGAPDSSAYTQNSRTGAARAAKNMKIALYVDSSHMDLYIAPAIFANGSTNLDIVLDNVLIKNLSINDASYTSEYPIDVEMKVAENLSPGLHVLELNDNDAVAGRHVVLYYTRLRKSTKQIVVKHSAVTGDSGAKVKIPIIEKSNIEIMSNTTQHTHFIFDDIPTSRLLKNIDIEVKTTLNNGEGIFIMGNYRGGGTSEHMPRPGVLLHIASNQLRVVEGINNGYTTSIAIVADASSYIGTSHTYRIICTTDGICTFYVDGVSVGTYTVTKNIFGGFFGIWKQTTNTINLEKIIVREEPTYHNILDA